MTKINLLAPLTDIWGKTNRQPVRDDEGLPVWKDEQTQIPETEVITYGMICVNSLVAVLPKEKPPEGIVSLKRNRLAEKIMTHMEKAKAAIAAMDKPVDEAKKTKKGTINLSTTESTMIAKLVRKVYLSPRTVAQIWTALEYKVEELEEPKPGVV